MTLSDQTIQTNLQSHLRVISNFQYFQFCNENLLAQSAEFVKTLVTSEHSSIKTVMLFWISVILLPQKLIMSTTDKLRTVSVPKLTLRDHIFS